MSDERVLYECPGCEMASLPGDLERHGHTSDGTGDTLSCPRCETPIVARGFVEYVQK